MRLIGNKTPALTDRELDFFLFPTISTNRNNI